MAICSSCGKEIEKGERVKEEYRHTILWKGIQDVKPADREVVSTFWGVYANLHPDSVRIDHFNCIANHGPSTGRNGNRHLIRFSRKVSQPGIY